MIEVGSRSHKENYIFFQDVPKKPKDGEKPKKPKGPEPHKEQCICEMCTCGYVLSYNFTLFLLIFFSLCDVIKEYK